MLYSPMTSKSPPAEPALAPPVAGSTPAMRLPGAFEPPPYVDERLVRPETREQMVRGHLIHAAPAKAEHADQHTRLDYIIRGNLTTGYIASTDLLTRAGPHSDFATDTCIRRAGIDPRSGSRYLEELAFEIVNEQSRRFMIDRAEDLTACGVRRLLVIFVKKGQVCEWSPTEHRFVPLDLDSMLEDPTLSQPIRIRALLDAAEADDSVAGALIAKDNPLIAKVRAKDRAEGHTEGHTEGPYRGLYRGPHPGHRDRMHPARPPARSHRARPPRHPRPRRPRPAARPPRDRAPLARTLTTEGRRRSGDTPQIGRGTRRQYAPECLALRRAATNPSPNYPMCQFRDQPPRWNRANTSHSAIAHATKPSQWANTKEPIAPRHAS